MKRIIAAILFAAITLSVISCGGAKPADTSASLNEDTAKSTEATVETKAETPTQAVTEAPTENVTQAPVTEVPVTEAPVTEAPVTGVPTEPATEPVTEAPVTEAPTEPVTEAPVTEAPTEPATEAPTEPVTEAPKTIPDNAYFYDRIYIVPPEYYTMQEFAGLPSGLREGYDPGLCFFNFSISAAAPLQGEAASVAFVQSGQPGATILGYRSFKVDGYDVEQIDYEWATQPIVQSMVTVHLEDYNVIVLFAALTTIDNALEEYTAIIDTLGIAY